MNPMATSKADILKTSRELIQQNGWAAVNIRAVAAACGVSVGCIYNYFGSKTELVSAAVESIWNDIFHHPDDETVFQDTLSALHARSCPRLALRTTDNAGAARLLGENRVPCTLEDGWLTLPLLSDADAASLSRFLASHRVDLLRMEERQKSLEDLFLELTGREESL